MTGRGAAALVGAVFAIAAAAPAAALATASPPRATPPPAGDGSQGREPFPFQADDPAPAPKPDLDVRYDATGEARVSASVAGPDLRARNELRRRLGSSAVVQPAPLSGGLEMVAKLDGYLTARGDADPADIALAFVRDHAAAYGIAPSDVDALVLVDRYTTPDGITHLRWQQRIDGVPLYDDDLRANVADDGRLINVIGSPRTDVAGTPAAPALGARQALGSALDSAGVDDPAPRVADQSGRSLDTDFAGSFDTAQLTLFGDADGVRLAWRVLAGAGPDAAYEMVVDAATGEVLRRTQLMSEANAASVYDNYPGAPAGGTAHTVDLSQWLTNPNTTDDLAGPNSFAWGDFNDDDTYSDGGPANCLENICPSNGAPPFQWVKPYPNIQFASGNCPTVGCGWNFNVLGGTFVNDGNPNNDGWGFTTLDRTGAQAFYFVNTFHDYLRDDPQIAFTQASHNFEGNDPIFTQVVDGANSAGGLPDPNHINNANMLPLPDGTPSRMQMYLFAPTSNQPAIRAISGADSAAILYHEYTHGLSGRLIVDSGGTTSLVPNRPQPGALGEGYSDLYAEDYLVDHGLQPDTSAPGEIRADEFAALSSTVRRQPIDCPVVSPCPGTASAGAGGFTYGDFGHVVGQPEVHADGEIWAETLWDLRSVVGSDTAQSLITGGMRLTPSFPTYLQARDGILQQANAIGGSSLYYQVWAVFAARGMGLNAFTAGPDDAAPLEDFTAPQPPPTTTCRGQAVTLAGTRAGERIRGTSRRDVINGLGGNDTINGRGGSDLICGGRGRDRLNGGGGRDTLIGGTGRDDCIGGPSHDRAGGCELGHQ